MPFVTSTGGVLVGKRESGARDVRRKYAEIFADIEKLIDHQSR